MPKFFTQVKEFFFNLFFPPNCINCQRERSFLCEDCLSLIDISQNQYCPFCRPPKIVLDGRTCNFCKRTKNLDGLYSAASYQNFIIKKAISQFKYEPYVKALVKPLSLLIIKHFQLIEHPSEAKGEDEDEVLIAYPSEAKGREERMFFEHRFDTDKTALIPVPLTKKKLKRRGFNQSEQIAKELSAFFKVPLISDVLLKIKETPSQVELSGREREENVRGVFFCKNPNTVKGKKILLVDDVFTTGSTMEECARVLKNAGAKEVWGVVLARE